MNRQECVLITGASGGIGLELARRFAADKMDLILVARDSVKLSALAAELKAKHSITAEVVATDLAVPGSADALASTLLDRGLTPTILVNNAGFGVYGEFSHTDREAESRMIELNITTLTRLTKLFLPGMLKAGRGRILSVASTAAFQPGPLMAVYYATKAYVLSFSEALAEELRGTGVTVTTLCPGPTRTGFQAAADLERSRLMSGVLFSVEGVADAGYAGVMKGRRVVVPGLINKVQVFSVRWLPRYVLTRVVAWIQGAR